MDKSTPTKSLHGYSGAFPDFHIVSHCGGEGGIRGGFGKRPGFFRIFLPLPLTNDIDGVDVVDIIDIIDVVDVVDEGCEMI